MSDPQADSSGRARRTFLTGAGLAAGAAVLAQASPAAATPPSTLVDHDLSSDLRFIDDLDSTPSLGSVDLGDGFARATFSAMGDMAAMTLRIKVGAGASTGDGPWCFDSADFPTGFKSAAVPSDVTAVGTSAWPGIGTVLDLTSPNVNQVAVGAAWADWSLVSLGSGTLMVFALLDRYNDGSGSVMLNYAGQVPFGRTLGEGVLLYQSMVYLRDTSED